MNSFGIGLPELIVLFVMVVFYLIPIAGFIWALVTLRHIRIAQDDLRRSVAAIERSLQKGT